MVWGSRRTQLSWRSITWVSKQHRLRGGVVEPVLVLLVRLQSAQSCCSNRTNGPNKGAVLHLDAPLAQRGLHFLQLSQTAGGLLM